MSSDKSGPIIWQNLDRMRRMKYLLETGLLSDCSFTLLTDENDKITIRCHKFVLMCSSPVFERMYNGEFEESRNSENIVLDDVSAGDFRTFIEYLYLEDKEMAKLWDVCILQNLIYLGKKFMVDDLTDLCFSTIIKAIPKLTTEELINLYVYAHQMDHYDLIHKISVVCISKHIAIFQSPAILDLSLDYFLSFIRTMSVLEGSHSHINLFAAIEKYCKEKIFIKESVPSKTNTEDDYDNEGKKVLKTESQSTAGNDTKEKTETEEKKISSEEKKMVPEVNKGNEKTEGEEIEALNQDQEKENELDKEKSGVGKEAENKEYIAKLLSFVKFETMTSTQFCNGPGLSSMLDFEMKYNILVKIVKSYPQQLNAFGKRQ